MATGPWYYNLGLSLSNTAVQHATARISRTLSTTQTAISKIGIATNKTQTAIANIAVPIYGPYGPWYYNIGLTLVPITKTQSATAKILQAPPSKTQSAKARIRNSSSKTQTAISQVSGWVLINVSSANTISYNDYTVPNGKTCRYRVTPVTSGVIGGYIYSNDVTYGGSGTSTKTQSAVARIAIRASNNLMIGYNF